jgi:Glycosyltransferase
VFYAHIDAILCPSSDWNDTFKYWGFKNDAIFYGVDVVDNTFWSAEERHQGNLPSKFLLAVGRQIERKNFQRLIVAFDKLYQGNPTCDIDLILVGKGPEQESLKAQIRPGLQSHVHFYPFQSQQNLRLFYQKALAFVMPSLQEQWGLVVNEAMASGLPIIISKQCGCAETLVKNEINGFVFDAYSMDELTSAFEKIVNLSSIEIETMRNNSLEIIKEWGLERFSFGAMDAINYALTNKRKKFYLLSKYLLKKWTGKYNIG